MKTENKILLPIVLLMIAAAIMGCKTEPELCALGAHLGIGESCSGTSCSLQDYRTANAKNSSHADYFPVPINRVGAEGNFASGTLTSAANNVVSAHKGLSTSDKNAIKNGVPAGKLLAVHIYNILGSYKWNGSILGIKVGETVMMIDTYLGAIASGSMPHAQVQPANVIRLAAGKDSDTEQLPVLAGGAAKEPKLGTVAKNFTKMTRAVRLRDSNLAKGIATRSKLA